MTTSGRMLKLLSLLQSRREWSGAELAERLEVTDRTVRRDVERLRELGYPVDATSGTAGGYRLRAGAALPPLLLDDDEAVAVAVGLLTATGGGVAGLEETSVRALAKLQQVLPARLRARVATVGDVTDTVPGRGGVDADVLAVLGAACRDREIVAFDHRRADGTVTRRRVEPYRLVTGYGLWYLLAHDPARADWRTFRVDRITDPRPTRARFSPRPTPADAVDLVRRSLREAPRRFTATATVRASADVVTARLQNPLPGRVRALEAGSCTVGLSADTVSRVVQDLVALDADYTLDADDELREQVRAAGRRLLGV